MSTLKIIREQRPRENSGKRCEFVFFIRRASFLWTLCLNASLTCYEPLLRRPHNKQNCKWDSRLGPFFFSRCFPRPLLRTSDRETGADKRKKHSSRIRVPFDATFLSYSPSSCKLSALVSMRFAIKHFVTPVELLTWLVRAKFSSRFQDLVVEKREFRQRRMTWHIWNLTQVYWKILIWQIAAWNSNKGNS